MKNSAFIYIVGVVLVSAVAGALYFHFRKRPVPPFDYKHISLLSYEWILNTATAIIRTSNLGQDVEVSLRVLPNLVAKDFFSTADGQVIFEALKLDEKQLNRVIIIMFSGQSVQLTPIVVTYDDLAEDFNDFIPKDKIYVKKIRVKNAN